MRMCACVFVWLRVVQHCAGEVQKGSWLERWITCVIKMNQTNHAEVPLMNHDYTEHEPTHTLSLSLSHRAWMAQTKPKLKGENRNGDDWEDWTEDRCVCVGGG